MISLDQILLLEQKVEGAVAKIAQLQAENDALRKSCAELTNALSAKSEQLSSFEQDQSRIENGIIKALDRLNSIENAVLEAAGQESSAQTKTAAPEEQPVPQGQPAQQNTAPTFQQPDVQPQQDTIRTGIDTFQPEHTENQTRFFDTEHASQDSSSDAADGTFSESDEAAAESDNSDNGMFDIF